MDLGHEPDECVQVDWLVLMAAGQPCPCVGAELGPGTRGWQTVVRAATAAPRGRDRSEC
jgi:hypothetical protein